MATRSETEICGEHIAENLAKSLMLVTALNPCSGYDRAMRIGKLVLAESVTLKQAAEKLGYVRPENSHRWVLAEAMTKAGAMLPGGGG